MGMSPNLKELWEEWELRAVVVLSLTIQVLLIILGHHRRYRPDAWLKALLWSCYMVADAIATYGLGKIATKLKQMQSNAHAASQELSPNAQITAFWAPFLLLHLGGPDTITAYALEDNELWLRHLLGLVVQLVGTLFIFFQALIGPDLSVLSLLIIFSGLIKYGQRVYVLRAASSERFRDSIPDPPLHSSKILEECELKKAEGYDVTPHEVIEVLGVFAESNSKADGDLSCPDEELLPNEPKEKRKRGGEKSNYSQSLLATTGGMLDFFRRLFGDKYFSIKMSDRNRAELAVAKDLINIFRRLFADLVLSFQDRHTSLSILKDKHYHVIFRVIEIELGFIYDMLYTKAMANNNRWGFTLRTMSILFTGMVLVHFSLSDTSHYPKPDINVTLLLIWAAFSLEIYALLILLFSDEAAYWLKNHCPAILNVAERFQPLYNRRRWSGSMAQYNLLSFALREKHMPCHRILEVLKINEKILKFLYKDDVKVSDFLKKWVITHLKSQATGEKEGPSVWTYRGDLSLKLYEQGNLKWSTNLEFDQSILIWHIATELLCHPEDPDSLRKPCFDEEHVKENIRSCSEISEQLSRYMLYLLVMYPFLLPIGVGRVKFRDIYVQLMSFFNEQKLIKKHTEDSKFNMARACAALRDDVNTQLDPIVAKGDKSKFTLYQGCRLASQLEKIGDQEKKWKMISSVWVEMLAYAAVKCKGHQHARQLRRGGEFLTHVWLLMAHLGLTDHFQIPHAPAIAELLVKRE